MLDEVDGMLAHDRDAGAEGVLMELAAAVSESTPRGRRAGTKIAEVFGRWLEFERPTIAAVGAKAAGRPTAASNRTVMPRHASCSGHTAEVS